MKYKLIKKYPGSPELETIVEHYRDNLWKQVSKTACCGVNDLINLVDNCSGNILVNARYLVKSKI